MDGVPVPFAPPALVRIAGPQDGPLVAAGLRALARDMGDPYRMSDADLARSGPGGAWVWQAALAEDAGGALRGVAVYSPFPSTTRGRIGAFVTDLWVDGAARGQGLGRRLLAAVRDDATRRWGPTFLRLNHADDNAAALAFYARLGFAATPGEVWVTLEDAALLRL